MLRCWLLAALMAAPLARGDEDSPVTRLFDTGGVSSQPLAPDAFEKLSSERQIPEDQTNHVFAGDAVLLNDKLVVVFRRQGTGPEVYAKTPGGPKLRAVLGHAADLKADRDAVGSLKIIENTPGGVALEIGMARGAQAAFRFRLTAGEAIVEIRSPDGAGFLDWRSKGRYLVVPDYFGDDMVYDVEALQARCLPAENLCLRLIDGGDALVMSVWRSREQEAWLAAGAETSGGLRPTRIRCLKDQSLWLAFLETPGLWQTSPEPGKIVVPFPAKWRATFARQNGVADSWDLDRGPAPEQSAGPHSGPWFVYPIDRSTATPLTATCPTDILRNTLGVGPCQYILACEGMAAQGDPTPNSVMGWIEKQFEQKKEKKTADDIRERLGVMTQHIAEARTRIERYSGFAAEVRKALGGKPEAEAFRPIVDDLERFAAAGLGPEFGPVPAGRIAAEVGALIGREDSLAPCRQAGERLRVIGAAQDRALARCRMSARRLKAQGLTLNVAAQPVGAELALDICRRAESILKTP